MLDFKIVPPGLPDPLQDQLSDRGPQSSWDLLADAIIRQSGYTMGNRCRVHWLRYSWIHWCCWRRMRIGVIEFQASYLTFGWSRAPTKTAACVHCGRIERYLM